MLHVLVLQWPVGAKVSGGGFEGHGPVNTEETKWQVPVRPPQPQGAFDEGTLSVSYDSVRNTVTINDRVFDRKLGNLFIVTLDRDRVVRTEQGLGFDERPIVTPRNDWASVMESFRRVFPKDDRIAKLELARTYDYGLRAYVGGDGKPIR